MWFTPRGAARARRFRFRLNRSVGDNHPWGTAK
jgi:hypothetical protein